MNNLTDFNFDYNFCHLTLNQQKKTNFYLFKNIVNLISKITHRMVKDAYHTLNVFKLESSLNKDTIYSNLDNITPTSILHHLARKLALLIR